MKNENLIHLKFEYTEALESKKDILLVEKSLMILSGTIKDYSSLKVKEINVKQKLYGKIRESIVEIKKLQKSVPQVEMPALKNEDNISKKEIVQKNAKMKNKDNSIESQLNEIQRKLRALNQE
ncbi:MAG: hypothetical protein AABX28_02865 [Nanoarchaeota archaeon]